MLSRILRWGLRALLVLLALLAIALTLLWGLPKWVSVHERPAPPTEAIALVGVTVFNPGESPEPAQTVLVRDGHIVALQAAEQALPEGYRRIEAAGHWLMPGLIDLHVHLFDESDLALLLAHGVTTARNMGGLPVHLRWREAVAGGQLAGARVYSAGPALNGVDIPMHLRVDNADQARAAVRQSKADGYDLVKIYDGLNAEAFHAAVDEAKQQGLAVAGHIPASVGFADVLAAYASVEHAEELLQNDLKNADDVAVDLLAKQWAQDGTPLVASLQVVQRLSDICGKGEAAVTPLLDKPQLNPLIAWLSGQSLRRFAIGDDGCAEFRASVARMHAVVGRLHRAGVPIALGTDSAPHATLAGVAVLDELQRLTVAGLSHEQALIAATTTAAKVLGQTNRLGRIAPGFAADAVLLASDPRHDFAVIASPQGVLADGRWFDASAREQLLAAGEDHAGWWLTAGRMFEGW